MNGIPPLPVDSRDAVMTARRRRDGTLHPGLLLDKYVASWDERTGEPGKLSEHVQKPACQDVVQASQQPPRGLDFDRLVQRRQTALAALDAFTFQATTSGPLTLHLARASALENAGICLHHVYGFACLPGTGLKGMTRAYAETVWFPTQFAADDTGQPRDATEREKAIQAWRTIEAVFGWSPNSDTGKTWKPNGIPRHADSESSHAGQIVFHDAWPVAWPRLMEDILNSHHNHYYQGTDAPGDWDSPIPVYFLSVRAGQTFQFALSRRSENVGDELIDRATEWLAGALTHAGAGAKTNAGYGAFRVEPLPDPTDAAVRQTWQQAVAAKTRQSFEGTLELVTPAFLAGANQYGPEAAEDCTLRPATLRGLLRWWWRTLHAGFLDVPTLRSLEAALWGDTNASGAIRIEVEPVGHLAPSEYNYKDRFDPKPDFKVQHGLADRPNMKTTQGLFYVSYGMDEKSRGEFRRRYYLEAGARWTVRLTARPSDWLRANSKKTNQTAARRPIGAEDVLHQALAALWLLANYGSAGSKARKGFGSLVLQANSADDWSLDACRVAGAELRHALQLGNRFDEQLAETAAIGLPHADWNRLIEVPVSSKDPWQVLDHVGFAYQTVAQAFAHREDKTALGLPRKIHGPMDAPIGPQKKRPHTHKKPQWLDFSKHDRRTRPQDARHASPVWIHVAPADQGYLVRAVAFPAAYLPSLEASQAFLTEFMKQFEQALRGPLGKSSASRSGARPPHRTSSGHRSAATTQTPQLPRPGDLVPAELAEEKTKKGGWRAKHPPSGLVGPIQNSQQVPEDKKAGDVLELIVALATLTQIAFRYPTDTELERRQKQTKGQHR